MEALRTFLEHHPDQLMPPPYESERPPYRAERRYLQAVAHQLGPDVDVDDTLAGRGVTEFLVSLMLE
ncbi:hypothetical protein JK364_51945 [Streptomyces sp. 110]|uniref:Uncharacterized protein n=1 Tax=Streptomyces endocoffeicus TaxID=2898945 RepID=A0ABS1Q830_9ACTN|nr:hypothetical protein [Streptomyces endocoffeicus]MBL1120719.1 hypothetical protein [Streptomyces endocoffeicus]